jgi:DNA repair photolyase
MSVIYEPSGKAREYAKLACNLYTGCDHGCLYCYAPAIRRMTRDEYKKPIPRRNILKEFEKECKKHYNTEKAILFCFMTDPYNSAEDDYRITREALKIALKHKIPIKILTKSTTVLNDIDVIKKFKKHISIGVTLTFDNNIDSEKWEPEASYPFERIETLKKLKNEGVYTWASFEPVIDINQSIGMLIKALPYVDHYKIGKINNFKGLDKEIDWSNFLNEAISILRGQKPFYIKQDLRRAAPEIQLYGNEVLADEFEPEPFYNE